MNKAIQPKTHDVTFKCTSCGATYTVESTIPQDTVAIDICSNCHPFFKGANSDQKAKGRAEKLASKFTGSKKSQAKAAK
jgi:large subunit ribosomal protein L31